MIRRLPDELGVSYASVGVMLEILARIEDLERQVMPGVAWPG